MNVILRPWSAADLDPLVLHANNRNVWINLKDRFPHPYTRADGEAWLRRQRAQAPPLTNFAIQAEGALAGGIGLERLPDIYRLTAEVGYWIGEPFWGKGVATSALRQFTDYAFDNFDFERLQATVFEWNAASAKVLEKCGYLFEARLRRHIIKDGRMGDSLLFAICRAPL